MPSKVSDINDNVNNSDVISIGWVGDSTELVVDGRIVTVLTTTGIDDAQKIFTGALPDRLKDADDVTASWGPER